MDSRSQGFALLPKFGGDENVLSFDQALIQHVLYALADADLVSVSGGTVNMLVPSSQGSLNSYLGRVKTLVGPQADERYPGAVVQHGVWLLNLPSIVRQRHYC